MSVIGRKPFVNYIIDECSVEQVNGIISLLNNLGTPTHLSFKSISNNNKGVSYVIFNLNELQNQNVNGILVYLDASHCGLFAFDSSSGNLNEYKLSLANQSFEQIYEHLTVEELRQVCGDALTGGDGGEPLAPQIETTLYRHSINISCVDDVGDSMSETFEVINTYSGAYSGKINLKFLFAGSVSMKYVYYQGPATVLYIGDITGYNGIECVFAVAGGESTMYEQMYGTISVTSDTVEEL